MPTELTRRDALKLIPGAAAVALLPSAALPPVPTPADYDAAWQKIAETLWTGRIDPEYLRPYSGNRSDVSQWLRYMWENPSPRWGPLSTAERTAAGKLIATGEFWPLSV